MLLKNLSLKRRHGSGIVSWDQESPEEYKAWRSTLKRAKWGWEIGFTFLSVKAKRFYSSGELLYRLEVYDYWCTIGNKVDQLLFVIWHHCNNLRIKLALFLWMTTKLVVEWIVKKLIITAGSRTNWKMCQEIKFN